MTNQGFGKISKQEWSLEQTVEDLLFRHLVCLEPLRSWPIQIGEVCTQIYTDKFKKWREVEDDH